jgi:hypothetical protein
MLRPKLGEVSRLQEDINKINVSTANKQNELIAEIRNLDSINKSLENELVVLRTKPGEITKLENELKLANNNYTATLNNLSIEIKNRDADILSLKTQMKDYIDIQNKYKDISELHKSSEIHFKTIIDKINRDLMNLREENMNLKSKEHSLSLELQKQRDIMNSSKSGSDLAYKSLLEEKNYETERLTKRINELEYSYETLEKNFQKMKEEYLRELADAKKIPLEEKDKSNRLEKENFQLLAQVEGLEKKLGISQFEYAEAIAKLKTKLENIQEREVELKAKEEAYRNAPPKLLDPTIKRARDEALANLRHSKLELAKVKEDNINLTTKLDAAENVVKDLVKEKETLMSAHSELKQAFVANLNTLQAELKEKSEKLNELLEKKK